MTSMMCSTMTRVMPLRMDPPHQLDRRLDLDRGQPGKRLVEQHEARLAGQHAGDLEPLAARRAEAAGALLRLPAEPDELHHLLRRLARLARVRDGAGRRRP